MARKVIINGVEYAGLAAAARALQVDPKTIRTRTDCGAEGYAWGEENTEMGRGGLRREVIINGVKYESIAQAARNLGVSRAILCTQLMLNISNHKFTELPAEKQNKIQDTAKKPVMVQGVEYASIILAARVTGITPRTIRRRAALQVDGYKFL